jgi:hypothetical protein
MLEDGIFHALIQRCFARRSNDYRQDCKLQEEKSNLQSLIQTCFARNFHRTGQACKMLRRGILHALIKRTLEDNVFHLSAYGDAQCYSTFTSSVGGRGVISRKRQFRKRQNPIFRVPFPPIPPLPPIAIVVRYVPRTPLPPFRRSLPAPPCRRLPVWATRPDRQRWLAAGRRSVSAGFFSSSSATVRKLQRSFSPRDAAQTYNRAVGDRPIDFRRAASSKTIDGLRQGNV